MVCVCGRRGGGGGMTMIADDVAHRVLLAPVLDPATMSQGRGGGCPCPGSHWQARPPWAWVADRVVHPQLAPAPVLRGAVVQPRVEAEVARVGQVGRHR